MFKINVCCVKEGGKYDSDYVNTLYLMTKRNLTIPFDFICLTENPQNLFKQIKVINLEDRSIKGWWNKCLLFKPGFLSGSCLYLDLDMIIIKNIDEFIINNQCLNILCNPQSVNNKIKYRINSSMMFWNADNKELNKIWFQYAENKLFYDNHKALLHMEKGDQKVILESSVKYKFFSSDKIRYFKFIEKKEIKETLVENISIIVCKGKKQKDHKSNYFVKNYWK